MDPRLQELHTAGAARLDPVGWHYIEVLARHTGTQAGAVQALLQDKLERALEAFAARLQALTPPPPGANQTAQPGDAPSPLAQLLQDILPRADDAHAAPAAPAMTPAPGWRAESPRVKQFRQQLSKISVQKQVRQAIAQAPQNAGPINSHMLVLRALGLMRDISPDYLDRFMGYVDTLLCLEETEKNRLTTTRKTPPSRTRK